MKHEFMINLKDVQPSQLYICSEKLARVLEWFNPNDCSTYESIPIRKLNGKVIFTDGHTRAFAAYIGSVEEVKVHWDEDELDWNDYQICVDWCLKEGIKNISDLKNRVIDKKEYEVLWLERCKNMHEEPENK